MKTTYSNPTARKLNAVSRTRTARPRPAMPRRGAPRNLKRRVLRQDNGGTMILVLGVLGLVFGPVGVVAWIMGVSYEKSCRARGVVPNGMGTGGKVLGMVGTVLLALWFLLSLTGRFAPFSFFPF